jgi:hypothetical protein
MATRRKSGQHARGVGADINGVRTKSERVLGAVGAAVVCMRRNNRKVKS